MKSDIGTEVEVSDNKDGDDWVIKTLTWVNKDGDCFDYETGDTNWSYARRIKKDLYND